MTQESRVYSMMVEHDQSVPMIEQINQIMDALLDHGCFARNLVIEADRGDRSRAKLDHDLIVPITKPAP